MCSATGQSLIALHSNDDVSFYQTFNEAMTAAIDGDTLYLPARGFTELIIDKAVHIVGIGYHPDSTSATGDTHVSTYIKILNTASGGSIQGIRVFYYIQFGTSTSNDNVQNFLIKRCYLEQGIYFSCCGTNLEAMNNSVIECVIGGQVSGYNAQNNIFANNVIYGPLISWKTSLFSNNIFNNNSSDAMNTVDNCTFNNNIFTAEGYTDYSVNNNFFNNNIFGDMVGITPCDIYDYSNTCDANVTNVNESNFFLQWTDGSSISNYFLQDFHLSPSSPATDAANDDGDCGIYGGIFPWKDGGIPHNPHIQIQTISNATDENGDLEINIKVQAQDN